ncbi:hypothetical protein K2Z83_03260 [Oscillochloris sp. ZM17-4]|uniref:hypothetical protein n=1 Tax=Oscillochloris sp. ZM17-4 TaxID=2866714 RepID=UPI001C73D3EA|nr:hypothetical protein [Oscillochloris sp. ZM17-4]MBX0326701.1 hypothetical protein [Oscillochloris sp. ZM17-4]
MLYYPYGIDLFWQTLQFSQGVAALPITLLLGPLAGFNWTVLTSFVFGGYVTFLFARRVTGHTQAALVAGMIFAFSPYHMQKMVDGGLEVTAIQWLPCYCFALYMLLERPSWQRSLLSGALLLWVSLGSWYYGLFCVLTTACASLVWLLVPGSVDAPGGQQQRWRWPDAKRWISAVWGVTPLIWWGLVLAPRIIGLTAQPDALWDMRSIQADRSADLMDFFLPNPLHPLWGEALRAAREQLYPQAIIWNVSLGWVGLAFGLVGVLAAWGHARRWLALLLLTMLLAMGPTLRMFGHNTGLPLPFALIQNLPGIRSAQRPSHLAVIASLMLAILAAYGFAWLIQRLPTRSLRLAITAGALGLILAFDTYAGPMQLVSRTVDPFYATMPPPPAAAPGRPSGAVMPLPLYLNINRSENLTTQMVHHWPILGGYVARPPTYTFARYTPGVRELEGQLPPLDDVVSPGWPESGQRGLAAYAIRYITFDLTSDKDSYFARVRHHAELLQLGQPIFADTQLEVYEVPQTWPVGPIGYLGAGWQDLEQAPPYRWRWMGEQAELQLFNPQDYPVRATIEFLAASYQQDRPLDLRLDTNILAQINIPTDGPQMQHLSFLLEPGEHRVHLSAPATPDGQRSNMPISVRVFALSFRFTELGKGL